jgi:hypothetical protein
MTANKKPYTLQQRISTFVDWIASEASREDETRGRADNVRTKIKAEAITDKLTIRSTPSSGSFATRTGLRRHMRGTSEVEGFDVDVPFVVSPETKDDEKLEVLLPRFAKYARAAYPETDQETTKSSVRLMFADKMNFDIVPLLATADPERQILIRAGGERRETSVQKHVDFVRSRTKKSNETPGVVLFNECVRLLKWLRCVRQCDTASQTLSDVPSFLVILLSAYAFDACGVKATYAETMADWLGFLARVIRKRQVVCFTDYFPAPAATVSAQWWVYDPLNRENNVVSAWQKLDIDEFADWLEDARDNLYDAIVAFRDDRESDGLVIMAKVFGNAFLHHSEPTP